MSNEQEILQYLSGFKTLYYERMPQEQKDGFDRMIQLLQDIFLKNTK